MNLTPEEKHRIEEEERKRFAEEQYRAQVRASLNSSPAADAAPEKKSTNPGWYLIAAVGIVALFIVGRAFLTSDDRPKPASPSSTPLPSIAPIRYVPVATKVASGQIVIPAGGHVDYRIQVEPEMKDARLVGTFKASGGQGNDVAAVIADDAGFTNWINGHQAMAFWSTHGKTTTDSFNVRLAPGTYHFAISNKFSLFSSKYLFIETELRYQRAEPNWR